MTAEAHRQVAVRLYLNGSRNLIHIEPRKTLADAIRDDCGLTGTHLGCEHGVCGACTVLANGAPIRACLTYAVQCEGWSIRTVEGLASDGELHPLQQAFWDEHGLQCGFCTPGFLMLLAGYIEQHPEPTDDELVDVLASNLCRCTGYGHILAAAKAAIERMRR